MKTHSHQDKLAMLWLAGWLAMHLLFILIFCAGKIKRVRKLKRVIQSGEPGHVNAAVSTINYSTLTVWDMLSLDFLSISFSALSLLYFILPYYEESVKPLAMKWAIHAWLRGIKKARGGVPLQAWKSFLKMCLTSRIKTLLIFIQPYDRGLNFLCLSSYRQTDSNRVDDMSIQEHILPCRDPCTASSGT